MTVKRVLRQWLVDGRLRFLGRLLYDGAVSAELAGQRALDALRSGGRRPDQGLVNQRLTAVIKTFERPQALRRLLASMRRFYPALPIIVVDDSRAPVQPAGVRTIVLPYDSGVSAGRKEGLRAVATDYVLILDDDFIFTGDTRLAPALAVMESLPQVDIMGGEVVYLPFYKKVHYTRRPGEQARMGGLPVYDKVANFYIARTDRLRLVDWDPAIKRIDHADFFNRARGKLTTVFNPDLKCLHAQTPFDKAYMQKRLDIEADAAVIHLRRYHQSKF